MSTLTQNNKYIHPSKFYYPFYLPLQMKGEYSQRKMKEYHAITYGLNSIPTVVEDIEKRALFFKDFITFLDKRIKIEIQYSDKLYQLALESGEALHPKTPSQEFYRTIIHLVQEEANTAKVMANHILHEILHPLRLVQDEDAPQQKKLLMLAQSMEKDKLSFWEKMEKSKTKFEKKNKDLEKLKMEYLSALLGTEQLERKTKLYLKVSSCEEETSPLRKQYQQLSNKYNDLIETNSIRMDKILTQLEAIEIKKIALMKQSIVGWHTLKFDSAYKSLNNQTLLMKVDRINPESEIAMHSADEIVKQKNQLLRPFVNGLEYVDRLFERVENKSIEDVILYGQSNEHKTELNKVFDQDIIDPASILESRSIRLIIIFKRVFEVAIPDADPIFEEFQYLIKGSFKMRKDFILCLQKFRINGIVQMKTQCFPAIMKVLQSFLNHCQKQLDTYNAKQLMVLSVTYYFLAQVDSKGNPILPKDHSHHLFKPNQQIDKAQFQHIPQGHVYAKSQNSQPRQHFYSEIKGKVVQSEESKSYKEEKKEDREEQKEEKGEKEEKREKEEKGEENEEEKKEEKKEETEKQIKEEFEENNQNKETQDHSIFNSQVEASFRECQDNNYSSSIVVNARFEGDENIEALEQNVSFKKGESEKEKQLTKIDLQDLISKHPIWSHIGWWEAAILESIYEETKIKIKKAEVSISIWDIKAGGMRKCESGEEITFQNICFNQLAYYVHNLNLFQIHPKTILSYAEKFFKYLSFSEKMEQDILMMCPKIQALHRQNTC